MSKRFRWMALLTVAVVVLVAAGIRSGSQTLESVQAAAAAPPITVVIDAGHGGEDGGAVSVSGVLESRLNLEIAERADAFLALLGYGTRMVRDSDTAIYDPSAETLSQKKASDLHNRAALVNETPGALLLSIHQNTYSDGRYHGAQVFYARTEGSQALAERLQETLTGVLDPDNHRKAKTADSVYLLNHIACTGVLVECGFLSNQEEDLRLQDAGYQTKLVLAMGAALNGWALGELEKLEV